MLDNSRDEGGARSDDNDNDTGGARSDDSEDNDEDDQHDDVLSTTTKMKLEMRTKRVQPTQKERRGATARTVQVRSTDTNRKTSHQDDVKSRGVTVNVSRNDVERQSQRRERQRNVESRQRVVVRHIFLHDPSDKTRGK